MTGELDALRRVRPPTDGPAPALVADERNRLMAVIARERTTDADPPVPSPAPRPDRRRRWLVPAVVVASAATAAAGWAVLRPDAETTTAVACGDSIVSSSTGDPVADCAALWRREKGTEPPPLVAYVTSGGGVQVLPADEDPPDGFEPLDRSFRQDASVIELEAELGDISRGLPSGCLSEAEARGVVEAQLRRLGFTGWTITTRAANRAPVEVVPSSGAENPDQPPCSTYTHAVIHAEEQQVELIADLGWPLPRDLPVVELAHRLTRQLVEGPDARCLTVDQAAELARREAATLGLSEAKREVVFHVVPAADPAQPTCARVTTVVGGTAEITLRAVPR